MHWAGRHRTHELLWIVIGLQFSEGGCIRVLQALAYVIIRPDLESVPDKVVHMCIGFGPLGVSNLPSFMEEGCGLQIVMYSARGSLVLPLCGIQLGCNVLYVSSTAVVME